jgi:hypothetical protein
MLHPYGVYILACDAQYDQLIALVNSIEANVSAEMPICIIPANWSTVRIQAFIAERANLSLFDDGASIQRWESFAASVWQSLSVVNQVSQRYARHYDEVEQFRKFCAFDGPFEKFVFYDVASLAMKPLEDCWAKLDEYDFVLDDWNHAKPASLSAFDRTIVNRAMTAELGLEGLSDRIHGARWFAAKRGAIDESALELLRDRLVNQGEVRWLNALNWWSDDELFSYMTLRCRADGPSRLFNYVLSPDKRESTGNCAMADGLMPMGAMLYCLAEAPEPRGLKPIHRVDFRHYDSFYFSLLCAGESVAVPFDYIFLHYRYWHQRCRCSQRSQRVIRLRVRSSARARWVRAVPNRRRSLASTRAY